MEFTKWSDWIKLPTKTLAGLCIVFAILIFSNESSLEKFGLQSFVSEYSWNDNCEPRAKVFRVVAVTRRCRLAIPSVPGTVQKVVRRFKP